MKLSIPTPSDTMEAIMLSVAWLTVGLRDEAAKPLMVIDGGRTITRPTPAMVHNDSWPFKLAGAYAAPQDPTPLADILEPPSALDTAQEEHDVVALDLLESGQWEPTIDSADVWSLFPSHAATVIECHGNSALGSQCECPECEPNDSDVPSYEPMDGADMVDTMTHIEDLHNLLFDMFCNDDCNDPCDNPECGL